MSNFLIFVVFQMILTQKVLNVIKAGFHRSWLIYIYIYIYIYRKQIRPTYLILILNATVNSHFLA